MKVMNRRSFMTRASATVAAAAWVSAGPRNLAADPLGRAPGIQLYTVADALKTDVPGTLHALRKIGYRFVEIADFANLPAAEMRKALDVADLTCPSTHLRLGADDPSPLFEQAHAVGAHYAVSSVLIAKPMGNSMEEAFKALSTLTLDDFRRTAELANRIGARAKQAGLQFAYHNHNFEFKDQGNGETGYDLLLKETDPELVKFELDCGWMVAAGRSPIEYFKKHPHRYRLIHVKDFLPSAGPSTELMGADRPKGTELGHGRIDYKPIFAAAKAAGIDYYFSEQEPPIESKSSIEAAKINFDYMHAM